MEIATRLVCVPGERWGDVLSQHGASLVISHPLCCRVKSPFFRLSSSCIITIRPFISPKSRTTRWSRDHLFEHEKKSHLIQRIWKKEPSASNYMCRQGVHKGLPSGWILIWFHIDALTIELESFDKKAVFFEKICWLFHQMLLHGSCNLIKQWFESQSKFNLENDQNRLMGLLTLVTLSLDPEISQNPGLGQMSNWSCWGSFPD